MNALLAAETMSGRDGITAHALAHERLVDIMARYGRGPKTLAKRVDLDGEPGPKAGGPPRFTIG